MIVLSSLLLPNALPKIQARRHSDQPNPNIVPRVCTKVFKQGIYQKSTTKLDGAESHALRRATHTYFLSLTHTPVSVKEKLYYGTLSKNYVLASVLMVTSQDYFSPVCRRIAVDRQQNRAK